MIAATSSQNTTVPIITDGGSHRWQQEHPSGSGNVIYSAASSLAGLLLGYSGRGLMNLTNCLPRR